MKLKIFELGVSHRADVKEMGPRSVGDDGPLEHLERVGMFGRLPALERSTVEERIPTWGGLSGRQGRRAERCGNNQPQDHMTPLHLGAEPKA